MSFSYRDPDRFPLLLSTILMAWACTESAPPVPDPEGVSYGGPAEVWELSAEPTLEIGVRSGEEAYQFHRAESSVRLEDGTLVVANGGSQQLRYYDEAGQYLFAVGGEGEGPGEFGFPSRVRRAGQDSLLVWDQSLHRVSFFREEGEFLGSRLLTPSADVLFPGDDWLFGRFWVDSPVAPSARGPIRDALEAIPYQPEAGESRYVRVTRQGRLWVTETGQPSQDPMAWHIHELDGSIRAEVETPASFEIHDIGPDYVLGLFRDDLGINFIRLYELKKPVGSPPGPGLDLSPPAISPQSRRTLTEKQQEELALVRSFLKTMASLEEIYYSQHYTYTADADLLFSNPRNRPPEELQADILMAGEGGWIVSVTHTESGVFCTLAYGAQVPMGWMPGELICP
jgi:hypothetical protein